MTPEEMLRCADSFTDRVSDKDLDMSARSSSAINSTIFIVGSVLLESLNRIEDAIRALRPASDRSGDGWELKNLTERSRSR